VGIPVAHKVSYNRSMISIGNLLLLALAIILFIYWIFNFIILYHLVRFGVGTSPKKIALIFLMGSVSLFFLSVIFFANINTSVFGGFFSAMGTGLTFMPNIK